MRILVSLLIVSSVFLTACPAKDKAPVTTKQNTPSTSATQQQTTSVKHIATVDSSSDPIGEYGLCTLGMKNLGEDTELYHIVRTDTTAFQTAVDEGRVIVIPNGTEVEVVDVNTPSGMSKFSYEGNDWYTYTLDLVNKQGERLNLQSNLKDL